MWPCGLYLPALSLSPIQTVHGMACMGLGFGQCSVRHAAPSHMPCALTHTHTTYLSCHHYLPFPTYTTAASMPYSHLPAFFYLHEFPISVGQFFFSSSIYMLLYTTYPSFSFYTHTFLWAGWDTSVPHTFYLPTSLTFAFSLYYLPAAVPFCLCRDIFLLYLPLLPPPPLACPTHHLSLTPTHRTCLYTHLPTHLYPSCCHPSPYKLAHFSHACACCASQACQYHHRTLLPVCTSFTAFALQPSRVLPALLCLPPGRVGTTFLLHAHHLPVFNISTLPLTILAPHTASLVLLPAWQNTVHLRHTTVFCPYALPVYLLCLTAALKQHLLPLTPIFIAFTRALYPLTILLLHLAFLQTDRHGGTSRCVISPIAYHTVNRRRRLLRITHRFFSPYFHTTHAGYLVLVGAWW